MPAPIIDGLVTFIQDQLEISVWDGEVPRQDVAGDQIVLPATKPIFKVAMTENGLTRDWTIEDSYTDDGPMTVYLWATTRAMVEQWLTTLEGLLAQSTNWPEILTESPYYVYGLIIDNWTCIQLEGLRAKGGQLIYEGRLSFSIGIHGAVSTK